MNTAQKLYAGALLSVTSVASQAALVQADVTAIATEITGDTGMALATFMPVIGGALAAVIGITLLKRFGKKV